MKRVLSVAVVLAVQVAVSAACGETFPIGAPCVPDREYDPQFNGFSENEAVIESRSYQCQTRVCLVNHFRGRVSCPYGQGCSVPGSDMPVTAAVPPQCADRRPNTAVYCSCRCADINGGRPNDQKFCDCPDGFACEPFVSSTGRGNEGLTGSYCIKQGTKYDANTACTGEKCDARTKNCE